MSVDERSRHRLYLKLEEILGPDEAGTLMDHLPPTGFANLATKDDVHLLRTDVEGLRNELVGRSDSLRSELIRRMDGLGESIEHRLTARIEQSSRRLVMWMSTMVLMTGGLAFAAGRFA